MTSSACCASASPGARASRGALLAAGLIAAATFLLLALQLRGMTELVGNFTKYPEAAARLLDGSLSAERRWDFSPLYLLLIAAAAKLAARPLPLVLGVQFALAALSVGLLFLVLERHFGRWPALAGAAALALNPSLAIYSGILEPEPLMLFLLVLLLFLSETSSAAGGLAAGSAMALCLLTRPGMLVLALALPIAWALRLRGAALRRVLLAYVAPPAAVVLALAAAGEPVPPPVMSPGLVAYEGNGPLATGTGVTYRQLVTSLAGDLGQGSDSQHEAYRLLARRTAGVQLTQDQTSRFWVTRTLRWIADHPRHFLALEARKLFYLFHGYRWHDLNVAFRLDRALDARRVAFIPLALVSSLAIAGLLLEGPRWRERIVPYAGFANQAAVMLLSYVTDRQRLALLPFLVFFAVAAVAAACRGGGRRRLAFLAVPPLALALSLPTAAVEDNRRVQSSIVAAMAARQAASRQADAGALAAAARSSAEAVALLPPYALDGAQRARLPFGAGGIAAAALREFDRLPADEPKSSFDRALLLIDAGGLDEAEALLLRLERERVRLYRTPYPCPPPAFHLARIAARRGERGLALARLRQALELAPGDLQALAWLAVLSGDQRAEERLGRYYDAASASLALGQAALEAAPPGAATEHFLRLTTLVPEFRDGWLYLAAALADAGRCEEARGAFSRALERSQDSVFLGARVVPAFTRCAEGTPPGDYARFFLGKVLHQYGRLEEARAVLAASLAATGREPVAVALAQVEEDLRRAGADGFPAPPGAGGGR